MPLTRIHFTVSPAQLKALDRFALSLGLDRSNAIRYCIARTIEAEARQKTEPPVSFK